MIEFNGRINGEAEKRFLYRARVLGQNILLIGLLLVSPTFVFIAVKFNYWPFLLWFFIMFLAIILLSRIPKGKKEIEKIIPKKIFVQDEYIVCVANSYTESRLLSDVKLVRDFGEFYELVFPLGKVSDKFICQKDLLTKGTLEEFEALFGDSLVVMSKK